MKLIWIGDGDTSSDMTKNKIYELVPESHHNQEFGDLYYLVVNNHGNKVFYPRSLFKDLLKLREEKINEILK